MSDSNTFENAQLLLIFNNTDITGIGDAGGLRGSASAGSLYLAAYTADPGEAGGPSTNEATYTSYARVAVARNSGGWTVSGNQASNTATVNFPQCTGGTNTLTHWGICSAASGGILIGSGALSSSLSVSNGITPQISAGAAVYSKD